MLSLTALQGAALIAGHALFTKLLISFTLRVYQFVQPDPKLRQGIENSPYMERFQKAQANESEYAALLVSLLLFVSSRDDEAKASVMTSAIPAAVVGQMGYVWTRTLWGYPAIPSIAMAVMRYTGLLGLTLSLYQVAFP